MREREKEGERERRGRDLLLVDAGAERDVRAGDVVVDHEPLRQQLPHDHLPKQPLRVAAGPRLAAAHTDTCTF